MLLVFGFWLVVVKGKRVEDEDPLAHGSGRMSGKEPRGVPVGMGQGSWEGLVGSA